MKTCIALLLFIVAVAAFSSEKVPDLIIEEIQQGVYQHKSFSQVEGFGLVSSNGLVVVDNEKAFIVDTPWSERDTKKLVSWIEDNNYQLIGSISTHSHEDRTAGIKYLNANSIPTHASALTNTILKKEGRELAKQSFDDEKVSLADGLIEAFYPGGGHTIDNIVVWLPQSKILFGGCFVRSLDANGLGYTGEAYIEQWPGSVEKVLLKYPEAKLVIPGHGKAGDIRLLKHTKKLAESASSQ